MYCHAYYEALDLISEEVTRRFEQEDLFLIKEIEILMIKLANGNFKGTIPEAINNFLKDDVDIDQLQIQLCMLPDLIKAAFDNSVKEVVNIRTIANAMLESHVYQRMLTEIDKLLVLYFTFPVTTSTAERSFSSLRRIKTYLRNTMNACRLNNLLLSHVHKSKYTGFASVQKTFLVNFKLLFLYTENYVFIQYCVYLMVYIHTYYAWVDTPQV